MTDCFLSQSSGWARFGGNGARADVGRVPMLPAIHSLSKFTNRLGISCLLRRFLVISLFLQQ